MKHQTNAAAEHDVLDELRSDFKSWRRVVSQCAKSDVHIPASTEEQYKVVHGRILARCRNLADADLVPAARRHAALQLDELLRPWSSTKTLVDAPPSIVTNLVKSQSILDDRLGGESRGIRIGQLGKLMLTACLAALGGMLIFLVLQWTSSSAGIAQLHPVEGILTNIMMYLGRISFTERFAVAILVSWLFGTWLLSRLPTS